MQNSSFEETLRTALEVAHARLRRQHELVVEFGVQSLQALDTDRLLTLACAVAARGMDTRFAKVLQLQDDGQSLLLTHGVGWAPVDIGSATVGAGSASPAGHALVTNRPVLSNHLALEQRFCTPALLKRYGIERSLNVPIRGASAAFGVLEVDSGDSGDFVESDIVFMEGLANVIALSLERVAVQGDALAPNPFSESVLNSSPDCVEILALDGTVEFLNEAGRSQMQIERPQDVYGHAWTDLWPAAAHLQVNQVLHRVAQGESVRFEAFCPTIKGEPKWWDVNAAPILDGIGRTVKIIAISRDVTERHDHETALASLIAAQTLKLDAGDLRLEEIHHRVRNSLHLVNTLLLLQANLAGDDAVKHQLQTAAGRVVTIAKVHDRLYGSSDDGDISADEYLRSLLADIAQAVSDRTIDLRIEPLTVTPARLAPLGLVVSELVTNALKYGKGTVTVCVEGQGDHATVAVTDEGEGFPDSYPRPSGTGLGMRLVRSYSGFGTDAVQVDRAVACSRIQVKFKL